MSWNYRVVKYADDDGYGLHEIYYDGNGEVTSWTEQPIIVGDSPKDISQTLLTMRIDAKHRPVFLEAEWKRKEGKGRK